MNLISDQTRFADVYDLGDGRVLKAFKRIISEEKQDDFDLLVKGYFWTEAVAYKQMSESNLSQYIPEFYGVANPVELLGHLPDATQKYVADCGYIISKLSGTEGKLRAFVVNKEPTYEIAARLDSVYDEISIELRNLDVDASDCSCFVQEDDQFFFIDFATWSASPYEEELSVDDLSVFSRTNLENYIANCSKGIQHT
ncbi:hypothetical protein ACWU37_21600 (plasmid) [Photobacterium damselae subsp. damselae]|uniref:hypothetical protein n=1 Tax=Photobacterium damselae TaxID=38293 RepID=UPI0040695DDD